MQKRERLRVIREHVGTARAVLARFLDSEGRRKDAAETKKLVDHLKVHLDHRDLTRALNGSPTTKGKVEQADGKSKVRAKNEQAA